jgi:molybdopterin-guanine dinucleotide biosynthesis protein B
MVAVIGRKNSGKTTTALRLMQELRRRGHRVMSIKHGTHSFNIDPSTTDTYRHFHEGGAERVAMAAPNTFALVAHWTEELAPETIAERYFADADIVVCEGFKRSALPKIEVWRRAMHASPLYSEHPIGAAHHIAVITDVPDDLAVPFPVIRFSEERWAERMTDVVERTVMARV